jgi:hypothetical protein
MGPVSRRGLLLIAASLRWPESESAAGTGLSRSGS